MFFVDRKNYRLQNIQLSKNRLAPDKPDQRSVRVYVPLKLARPCLPVALPRLGLGFGPDMVENTGLEPVTSWLQTRRSPS